MPETPEPIKCPRQEAPCKNVKPDPRTPPVHLPESRAVCTNTIYIHVSPNHQKRQELTKPPRTSDW
ncbi:hypothetical protein HBI46_103370 [Parastagonospora nodorum]|nr:hypothetical protein HBH75_154530 [Parastagonospora nodorum]KAH5418645.1 hypothetical protein HBI46_103370 [Parastagonospora nodorum]